MNTETVTVFPPDGGYSYFDPSPAQISSRISALNLAASCILTGDDLNDERLKQEVGMELIETAAWLARKLTGYHDELDRQRRIG